MTPQGLEAHAVVCEDRQAVGIPQRRWVLMHCMGNGCRGPAMWQWHQPRQGDPLFHGAVFHLSGARFEHLERIACDSCGAGLSPEDLNCNLWVPSTAAQPPRAATAAQLERTMNDQQRNAAESVAGITIRCGQIGPTAQVKVDGYAGPAREPLPQTEVTVSAEPPRAIAALDANSPTYAAFVRLDKADCELRTELAALQVALFPVLLADPVKGTGEEAGCTNEVPPHSAVSAVISAHALSLERLVAHVRNIRNSLSI